MSRCVRLGLVPLLALAACAGAPPPPDWQLDAKGAVERAVEAQLAGRPRVAALEWERARAAVARTGRVDLVARVELTACAAERASLAVTTCERFERLRVDAPDAERAYADYLQGRIDAARLPLLPVAQQTTAGATRGPEADLELLRGVTDPLSRLVAAAVWQAGGRATPAVMNLAAETASAQGWRVPLLAWLKRLHERAGGDEAERLARRIRLVEDAGR